MFLNHNANKILTLVAMSLKVCFLAVASTALSLPASSYNSFVEDTDLPVLRVFHCLDNADCIPMV